MNLLRKENMTGIIVLLLLTLVVVFVVYWRTGTEAVPGDYHVKTGNYRLEDGQYGEAIAEFNKALEQNPKHAGAHLGLAITSMQMKLYEQSLTHFNKAIELDPSFAVAYADRGVLHDRMGRYEQALNDYRKALELDPKLAKGPGWLWRFMRNIQEKPPTIADRARYIEEELRKPTNERVLQVPEIDEQQRMYKK